MIMLILNFAHPFTDAQVKEIEEIAGEKIDEIIEIPSQIDHDLPFEQQTDSMLDRANLTTKDWQTKPILINLPSLNYSTAAMLAQLHGRMGFFPPVLRLRPDTEGVTPRFEAVEILNLQAMRERARKRR